MDFADKMGASITVPESTVKKANGKLAEARSFFIERKMDEAAMAMQQALDLLDKTGEEAIEARNSAMMWVFLIEWLCVTATFLFSGIILQGLLIRRKLYRSVGSTRGRAY